MQLEDLDELFKNLNTQLRNQKGESLLETKTDDDSILELKIDIIRDIVDTRLADVAYREASAERAEKKQKILGIIADKQDKKLHDMSITKLTKMIDEL
jgi:hypothetical protein